MNPTHRKPIQILLVEDSTADAELTRELLSETKAMHRLHWVRDGVAALRWLRQEDASDRVRPDMILLDLNLPRMGGLELLAALKQDKQLQAIPVIVLTMSNDEGDIQAAYAHQAAAFVTKPVDLGQFARVIRALDDFWLGVARLPGNKEQE
ncbi:response regulator [Thiocystis violacea]|uniref:response regulator n=1 Tax=Thiocystis violacea TaxID=13725 RepID=UPI0019060616|nr:response regulator [Thiocystis violacea]MBK1724629.1 hypothetical protein [Thiocystis violacea]